MGMGFRNPHRAWPFEEPDEPEPYRGIVHLRLSPKGDTSGRPLCHSEAKGSASPNRGKVTCQTCLNRAGILRGN